jgi:hypothetical protein
VFAKIDNLLGFYLNIVVRVFIFLKKIKTFASSRIKTLIFSHDIIYFQFFRVSEWPDFFSDQILFFPLKYQITSAKK